MNLSKQDELWLANYEDKILNVMNLDSPSYVDIKRSIDCIKSPEERGMVYRHLKVRLARYFHAMTLYNLKNKKQQVSEQIQSDLNVINNFKKLLEDKLYVESYFDNNELKGTVNKQRLNTTYIFCDELLEDLKSGSFHIFANYNISKFKKPKKALVKNFLKLFQENIRKGLPMLEKYRDYKLTDDKINTFVKYLDK